MGGDVPDWADESAFDHFYALMTIERVPETDQGGTLRVGDEMRIVELNWSVPRAKSGRSRESWANEFSGRTTQASPICSVYDPWAFSKTCMISPIVA